ncbi:MAG TPA: alkaline phosphatase [Lachnoclostridium phytofermentans]|uniref:Alkaline phosphatase n=1 Tax=Lachnoclostridium phytofermentans TaxID=66219 RepID=A0A3D2X7F5_9FIRM|nr:DedA family protein [Lachnoclostridium sp.]HCL03080.1 alkaline phosphatase [Lachnoclostridium phytofermentans]
METQAIFLAIENYGLWIVFFVVLLEYLNLPGFPAGVILPFAGAWSASHCDFIVAFLVTVVAGILGSILLYYLGRFGGEKLIRFFTGKSPKLKAKMEQLNKKIESKGAYAVFISKLIPVVRTLIGIPAGALRMNLTQYIVASTLGIIIWNGALFSFGYFIGGGFTV